MTKKQLILTVFLPIAVSVIIGVILIAFHNKIGVSSSAYLTVSKNEQTMRDELSDFTDQKQSLTAEIEGYDKIISDNSTLITEVESLEKELENYNSDIASARETSDNLSSELESKRAYLDGLSDLNTETEGKEFTIKAGEYKCPSEIESGRYKADGTGKIYLYTISNSLKDNIDLSVIDSHSYTFELASGEKIKIEGTVKLTKIQTN